MPNKPKLTFKQAAEPWEFELVYRLCHKVLAEETRIRETSPDGRLTDVVPEGGACFVALRGEELLGTISVSGERPFVIERKLPEIDLNALLPDIERPCEIKSLAIEKGRRGGVVFAGLSKVFLRYCREQGFDGAVTTAMNERVEFYARLGYKLLDAPAVPETGGRHSQAMYFKWDEISRLGSQILKSADENR
jgi:hypothetical protein